MFQWVSSVGLSFLGKEFFGISLELFGAKLEMLHLLSKHFLWRFHTSPRLNKLFLEFESKLHTASFVLDSSVFGHKGSLSNS